MASASVISQRNSRINQAGNNVHATTRTNNQKEGQYPQNSIRNASRILNKSGDNRAAVYPDHTPTQEPNTPINVQREKSYQQAGLVGNTDRDQTRNQKRSRIKRTIQRVPPIRAFTLGQRVRATKGLRTSATTKRVTKVLHKSNAWVLLGVWVFQFKLGVISLAFMSVAFGAEAIAEGSLVGRAIISVTDLVLNLTGVLTGANYNPESIAMAINTIVFLLASMMLIGVALSYTIFSNSNVKPFGSGLKIGVFLAGIVAALFPLLNLVPMYYIYSLVISRNPD